MSGTRKKVSFSPELVSSCTPVLDSKRRSSIPKKTKLELPNTYESPSRRKLSGVTKSKSKINENENEIVIAKENIDGICKGETCYRCPRDLIAPLPQIIEENNIIEETNPMLLDFICTAQNCGALWVVEEKKKKNFSSGIKKAPAVLIFRK